MNAGLSRKIWCQKRKPKDAEFIVLYVVTPAFYVCHLCLRWFVYWKADLECNLLRAVKIQFYV
jgi:hypothetical protein